MLPSFRLIAATFLCGFVVVFAGLRMAASLNDIHEGLPVMAAHAAPVSITPAADREARRGLAAVPVMYDLRFAVSTVAPTLVRVAPTVFDRPAPPLAIVPPKTCRQGNAVSTDLATDGRTGQGTRRSPKAPSRRSSRTRRSVPRPTRRRSSMLRPKPPEARHPKPLPPSSRKPRRSWKPSAAEPLIPEPDTTRLDRRAGSGR